jgi:hypothetical protein
VATLLWVAYFQLPSTRTLKHLLSKIPFECGLIKPVIENLKLHVESMDELDRCCTLIFDEVSLCKGFHYETSKQRISGFEDLGSLGRTDRYANHALVFMVRGIRKNYKQTVAYYFTRDTVKTHQLKQIIVYIIKQLQEVGLNVVATVCDQGSTNRTAIKELCGENRDRPSPFFFVVDGKRICTIFDVPHLLKNTRNALIDCAIEFSNKKHAKFEHIQAAFNLDQQTRTYRLLPKLKNEYFNFKDSYVKMKVKVAAQQLSHTVAAAIETFADKGKLPIEAMHTAEFVSFIDSLFDSLNGSQLHPSEGKNLKCALSKDSSHLQFWSDSLPRIRDWKIIDSKSGQLRTNFKFVEGWQITIRAIMHLWQNLKGMGLQYLSLRNLNQDPVENLFCQVRQHGICNTNPTCHQFVAALKTVVINNFSSPLSRGSNCKEDNCKSLGDFCTFLTENSSSADLDLHETDLDEEHELISECFVNEQNPASSYVAGYLLKKIDIPDCDTCKQNLFSNKTASHAFISHKERNKDLDCLLYPNDRVTELVDTIHIKLYEFLDDHGHQDRLEDTFKRKYFNLLNYSFCEQHHCHTEIINKCVRLTIFKYLRDNKNGKRTATTVGHSKKIKKFRAK